MLVPEKGLREVKMMDYIHQMSQWLSDLLFVWIFLEGQSVTFREDRPADSWSSWTVNNHINNKQGACWPRNESRVVMGQEVENVLPGVSNAPGEGDRSIILCRQQNVMMHFLPIWAILNKAECSCFTYVWITSAQWCPRYCVSVIDRQMSGGADHSSHLSLSQETKKECATVLMLLCVHYGQHWIKN